jgi:hypothetical protein
MSSLLAVSAWNQVVWLVKHLGLSMRSSVGMSVLIGGATVARANLLVVPSEVSHKRIKSRSPCALGPADLLCALHASSATLLTLLCTCTATMGSIKAACIQSCCVHAMKRLPLATRQPLHHSKLRHKSIMSASRCQIRNHLALLFAATRILAVMQPSRPYSPLQPKCSAIPPLLFSNLQ